MCTSSASLTGADVCHSMHELCGLLNRTLNAASARVLTLAVDSDPVVGTRALGPHDGQRLDVFGEAWKHELRLDALHAVVVVFLDADCGGAGDHVRGAQVGAQEQPESPAAAPDGAVEHQREGRALVQTSDLIRIPRLPRVRELGRNAVLTASVHHAAGTLDQVQPRREGFLLRAAHAAHASATGPVLICERGAEAAGEGDGDANVGRARPQLGGSRDSHSRPRDLDDPTLGAALAVHGQEGPAESTVFYSSRNMRAV